MPSQLQHRIRGARKAAGFESDGAAALSKRMLKLEHSMFVGCRRLLSFFERHHRLKNIDHLVKLNETVEHKVNIGVDSNAGFSCGNTSRY